MHQLQSRFEHGTKSPKRMAVSASQKDLDNNRYRKR